MGEHASADAATEVAAEGVIGMTSASWAGPEGPALIVSLGAPDPNSTLCAVAAAAAAAASCEGWNAAALKTVKSKSGGRRLFARRCRAPHKATATSCSLRNTRKEYKSICISRGSCWCCFYTVSNRCSSSSHTSSSMRDLTHHPATALLRLHRRISSVGVETPQPLVFAAHQPPHVPPLRLHRRDSWVPPRGIRDQAGGLCLRQQGLRTPPSCRCPFCYWARLSFGEDHEDLEAPTGPT